MHARGRAALLLAAVRTDRTFELREVRGVSAWVGRCIHCRSSVVVSTSGESPATVEHIVPRAHGGTDAPDNIAIACPRCNHRKGASVDARGPHDERYRATIAALLEERRRRFRDGDDA